MSRTGHSRYRRNRDRLKRTTDVCALCGGWIDPDLTHPHPRSFSADHITAYAHTHDNNTPLQATHLECNQSKGKRTPTPTTQHARQW